MRRTIMIPLLLAATSFSALSAQQTPRRRAPDVPRPVVVAGDLSAALSAVQPALWSAQQQLAAVAPQLEAMHVHLSAVARLEALKQLTPQHFEQIQHALGSLAALSPEHEEIPLLPSQGADTTAYRRAREEVNKRNFQRAAELFEDFIDRYPRSPYVDDAHYWQAYSLYRLGGTDNLEEARDLLEVHRRRYASTNSRGQADQLLLTVRTDLARSGDPEQAEQVARTANRVLDQQCPQRDDEDLRAVALNSLMQMGPENAMPVLKQIMAKKDACSAPLRRKAMFLVSQQRTTEKEAILLDAARNDPDSEVRSQAIFWLGQVNTEQALRAIEEVLNSTNDREVQEKAIFALSQQRSPRAGQILRTWAESDSRPLRMRETAIFHLSQQRDPQNGEFLRNLYGKLPNGQLKEKVLFALSQRRGEGNEKWLMDVALNQREDVEMRKKAVFWAGNMRAIPLQDFVGLYDRFNDRAMKEQLILLYSQRREREAIDKLLDIARNEKDLELRKRAIFWLSNSKDPRVQQLLLEIITK